MSTGRVATGFTSTANWLAHHTKTTRPVAASVVRLGYDLATHDRVRDALARGDLHLDQARVILRAVTALPDDLDPGLVTEAEEHLVAQAREWDARALKRLRDRILDVIEPENADAHEARLVEREEHQAAQACRFTMSDDGHGTTHGTAKIIPAVLGGRSEILDLGRSRRLHTKPQRIALGIRDGGCTTEGCDCPPALCHAHHDQPWSRGGPTDLDHGRLLCPRHHTYAHDPAYKMTRNPNGKVSFRRRP